nr:MAG TPA: hypothetical protein [Caudoviricetes sp.]
MGSKPTVWRTNRFPSLLRKENSFLATIRKIDVIS